MNNQVETIDQETGEVLSAEGKLIQSPGSPVELSVISAEINQQIATARRYPRRKDKIIAQEIVERATLNTEIATECFYKLKRNQRGSDEAKDIIGPSIRLAEIVRASYWNIRVASRFIGIDERVRGRAMVVVEAVAMDMQTNDAVLLSVSRSIMTSPKNGQPRMFTPDMVNVTMMAAQSIAQRDATLRLVPKALWIDGYHAALSTSRGDAATLNERRAKMLEAFAKYGITPNDIYVALGIEDVAEIKLDHMVDLAGMWTSLKEGEAVDLVLGRMAERSGAADRAAGEPARNPLDDKPRNGKGEDKPLPQANAPDPRILIADLEVAAGHPDPLKRDVAEKPQKRPSNEMEKTDSPPPGPRMEPAGEGVQQRGHIKTEPGYADAGYFAEALDVIAKATSATKLRSWWKTERALREKAQMDGVSTTHLHEAYERKLDAIEGRG